jgi:signal transduction histidine kinase
MVAVTRHPLKLRVRLALLVGTLVAAVAGLTAWACLLMAEAAFEGRFDAELDARVGDVESHIESLRDDVGERRGGARRHLLEVDTRSLERLLDPRRRFELGDEATALAVQHGLPVLEILDSSGEILSSAHWPERVGHRDSWGSSLPERTVAWSTVDTAHGPDLVLVGRRGLVAGTRRLELIGGRAVDARTLETLVGRSVAAILVPRVGPTLSTPATESPPGPRDDEEHAASTRSLVLRGPDGQSVGRIELTVDRAPLTRLLARLRWAVLGVMAVGAAIGAAGGAWIARRATEPIEETLGALDAVAAGEADYSFLHTTRDGLEALPEAFSRLHRAVEDQQRRRAAAERVAAWREVARRVAHEVKNPLAPIRLTIENLVKAKSRAPEMFDEIFHDGSRAILEEVEQLERLVTEFSEFARLPEPRPMATDLDELLDSVLALYGGEPGLAVDRKRAAGLPAVGADPGLVARALKNVVANAVQSMGVGGGTLTVETAAEDGWVVARIADTGPGFADGAERHLFEPYFTTRPEGTGLGMALAYRIVVEHGGMISAGNRAGGGAEVVVRLAPHTRRPDDSGKRGTGA